MAGSDRAVLTLLFDILTGKTGSISKTDFIPEKPLFNRESPVLQPFERATPESVGISSRDLMSLTVRLFNCKNVDMHHLMVLRHGKVICEISFFPYIKGDRHITYSVCKSFTGMAIGLLYDEGKLNLNDKVNDIFGSGTGIWNTVKLRELTIEHLLTMTSGVSFNEAGALSGNEWKKAFFASPLKTKPGTVFSYNSMNSYILSAVVTELTGLTMADFLKKRLFNKMGIENAFWEKSPEGITKGGWGMFITPEDMAKLGTLYLNKGKWNGEQLISEDFVKKATSKQVENGGEGYGYQLWIGKREDSFIFDGMMGQNVRVYPDLDMVIVNNAGDTDLFTSGEMDKVIDDFVDKLVVSDEPLLEDYMAETALKNLSEAMERGEYGRKISYYGGWRRKNSPILSKKNFAGKEKEFLKSINGASFEPADKSHGVFPLLLQMFHNNFTDGIKEVKFVCEDGKYYVLFYEGEAVHRIRICNKEPYYRVLDIKGEPYSIGSVSEYSEDEDGSPVIKLSVSFLEEVAKREIRFYFKENGKMIMKLDELPGREIMREGVEVAVGQALEANFIVKRTLGNVAEPFIKGAVMAKIRPVIECERMKQDFHKTCKHGS